MKNTILFILISISTLSQATELWLKVGEARHIPAPIDATIRVGSRGIVKAIDGPNGIRLVALKPGTTTLIVDRKNFLVRVSYSAQSEFAQALRAALKEMMGLKLYSDQTLLEVQGTLLRFSDWQTLARIASRYQGDYRFSARVLPDVGKQAIEHFQRLAREQGLPVLRFSANPYMTAHLPRAAKDLASEVTRVFAPFGIQARYSASDLAVAPLVRTRVILAEVSKTVSQDFGVQWPSEYSAQILPTLKGGSDSLLVALHALEAKGHAQILASPVLLCRSGGNADFHAGGEFPIRMISRGSREVQWKQHGVILRVKPKADYHGSMSVELETEVSLLDMANAVDGVPSLKRNSVKSHFDLTGKRTIALSGLLRQELGETREGLPWLTQIPVLGALFSSRKFLNHQTELVVFVTPEIYLPESDEKLEMPSGWISHEF